MGDDRKREREGGERRKRQTDRNREMGREGEETDRQTETTRDGGEETDRQTDRQTETDKRGEVANPLHIHKFPDT